MNVRHDRAGGGKEVRGRFGFPTIRLRARHIGIATVATLALVAILIVILVWPEARRQIHLSFVQQPVGFTELYFEGDRTTSLTAPDGRPQVGVDFTIADRGETDQEYVYQVQAIYGNRAGAEQTGRVEVPAMGRRRIFVRLDLPSPERWSTIDVRLLGRPERIHDNAPIGGDL